MKYEIQAETIGSEKEGEREGKIDGKKRVPVSAVVSDRNEPNW